MNQVITLNESQLKSLEKFKDFINDIPLGKVAVLNLAYIGGKMISKGFEFKTNRFTLVVGA